MSPPPTQVFIEDSDPLWQTGRIKNLAPEQKGHKICEQADLILLEFDCQLSPTCDLEKLLKLS